MTHLRLDYVWLDGYKPTANIRTKAQIIETDTVDISLDDVPDWGSMAVLHNRQKGTIPTAFSNRFVCTKTRCAKMHILYYARSLRVAVFAMRLITEA